MEATNMSGLDAASTSSTNSEIAAVNNNDVKKSSWVLPRSVITLALATLVVSLVTLAVCLIMKEYEKEKEKETGNKAEESQKKLDAGDSTINRDQINKERAEQADHAQKSDIFKNSFFVILLSLAGVSIATLLLEGALAIAKVVEDRVVQDRKASKATQQGEGEG